MKKQLRGGTMNEISALKSSKSALFLQNSNPLMKIEKFESRLELKWKDDIVVIFWVNQKNKITIRKVRKKEVKEIPLDIHGTDLLDIHNNYVKIIGDYLCFIAYGRTSNYIYVINLENWSKYVIQTKQLVIDYHLTEEMKIITIEKSDTIIYAGLYDVISGKTLDFDEAFDSEELTGYIQFCSYERSNGITSVFLYETDSEYEQVLIVKIDITVQNNSLEIDTIEEEIDDTIDENFRNFSIDVFSSYIVFINYDRLMIFDYDLSCLLDKPFGCEIYLLCNDPESPCVIIGLLNSECGGEDEIYIIDPKTEQIIHQDEIYLDGCECCWAGNQWVYLSKDGILKSVDKYGNEKIIGEINDDSMEIKYKSDRFLVITTYEEDCIYYVNLVSKEIVRIPTYYEVSNVNCSEKDILVSMTLNRYKIYSIIEILH